MQLIKNNKGLIKYEGSIRRSQVVTQNNEKWTK
jgi:hypothetical protein